MNYYKLFAVNIVPFMKLLKEEYKSPFGSFWSTMMLNYFRNGMKKRDVKNITKIATNLKI